MDNTEIAKQLGKQGGLKTSKLYGKEYFKRISALGAIARRKNAQNKATQSK